MRMALQRLRTSNLAPILVVEKLKACKNCETNLTENMTYCPNCGARIIKNRLSFKSLWNQVLDEVLGWDNKFFKTIKTLIVDPKDVVLGYINGTRKKYLSPFTLFALVTAIYGLLFIQIFPEFIDSTIEVQNEKMKDIFKTNPNNSFDQHYTSIMNKYYGFMMKYYSLINLGFLPFYSLFSYLTFWKKLNFVENMVVNTYIMSLISFLSIIIMTFNFFGIDLFALIYLIIFASYIYFFQQILSLTHFQTLKYTLKFMGITFFTYISLVILGGILFFVNKKLCFI